MVIDVVDRMMFRLIVSSSSHRDELIAALENVVCGWWEMLERKSPEELQLLYAD